MTGGLLLVDKPSGPTSYDLIRWIKRKIKGVKIGHCGTLDPLASGLMIILIGRATKKQSGLMGQNKIYKCGMRLGVATDTGDITGAVQQTLPVPPLDPQRIEEVRQKMIGPQMQIPPMYSALKRNGTPLYKLARQGQTVERAPRPIVLEALEFLNAGPADLEFRVRCSSGTYVRTLVEDIGRALGTVATMASLVREQIGDYSVSQALPGSTLQEMDQSQIEQRLAPVP